MQVSLNNIGGWGERIKVGAVGPLLAAEILEDSDRDATEKNLTALTATEILQEGDFCGDRDTDWLTDPAPCRPERPNQTDCWVPPDFREEKLSLGRQTESRFQILFSHLN